MSDHLTKPKPHLIVKEFDDGEGVVIDLKTRRYFRLNKTALVVWHGLEQGRSFEQITDQLKARFEVDDQRAADGISHFLESLESRDLVS